MPDAVVAAFPSSGAPTNAGTPPQVIIDQIKKEFVPYVTAVQVGTPVAFPNKDNIRHHVYSFSDAKSFELPLYKGTPTEPIVFDTGGVVVLGCNIHDWMLAYVYILDTPYFARTGDDGLAVLPGLPPGTYDIEVHHPRSKGRSGDARQQLEVTADGASLSVSLKLKPDFRRGRSTGSGGGDYR